MGGVYMLAADSALAKGLGDILLQQDELWVGRAAVKEPAFLLPSDWVQISSTHCRVHSGGNMNVRTLLHSVARSGKSFQ